MNKLTGAILLSALGLAMNTLPATAADKIVTKSQVVRFNDLNLASEAGAQTLYQRITLAARQVCAASDYRFGSRDYRKCIKQAVDDAVAKVNRPTLYAVAQSGKTHPAS
jgi:UrcA family protein